jgi:hypothetical protein
MTIGVERGRKVRKTLGPGVCGEHGGDPASVIFCHQIGLDYVSRSPSRIPVAKLAAAHANLQGKVKGVDKGEKEPSVSARNAAGGPEPSGPPACLVRRACSATRSRPIDPLVPPLSYLPRCFPLDSRPRSAGYSAPTREEQPANLCGLRSGGLPSPGRNCGGGGPFVSRRLTSR